MPSAARYSRVPSVANISTASVASSRASSEIPSRFATDSRARTLALLPCHGVSCARTGQVSTCWGSPVRGRGYIAAEYTVRRGILPRAGRPRPRRGSPTVATDRRRGPIRRRPRPRGASVKLLPWESLSQPFSSHNFPDLFQPTWVASLVLLIVLVAL